MVIHRGHGSFDFVRPAEQAVCPRLERERALSTRRYEVVLVELDEIESVEFAQTLEAGHRENDRVEVSGHQPREPRIDVAAQGCNVEVGPSSQRLEPPPGR